MKIALAANTAFWLLIALFVLGIRGAAHAQFIVPAGHFRAELILQSRYCNMVNRAQQK